MAPSVCTEPELDETRPDTVMCWIEGLAHLSDERPEDRTPGSVSMSIDGLGATPLRAVNTLPASSPVVQIGDDMTAGRLRATVPADTLGRCRVRVTTTSALGGSVKRKSASSIDDGCRLCRRERQEWRRIVRRVGQLGDKPSRQQRIAKMLLCQLPMGSGVAMRAIREP